MFGAWGLRSSDTRGEEADNFEEHYQVVVVEHMPTCWRESHRQARNWGVYPANGAVRVLMTREDAEELVEADSDEYDRILRDATVSDMSRYPRETLETLEVVS